MRKGDVAVKGIDGRHVNRARGQEAVDQIHIARRVAGRWTVQRQLPDDLV